MILIQKHKFVAKPSLVRVGGSMSHASDIARPKAMAK